MNKSQAKAYVFFKKHKHLKICFRTGYWHTRYFFKEIYAKVIDVIITTEKYNRGHILVHIVKVPTWTIINKENKFYRIYIREGIISDDLKSGKSKGFLKFHWNDELIVKIREL